MATFNQIDCASELSNTGFQSCVLDIGIIKGAFIVPENFKIVAANVAAMATFLKTNAQSASKTTRVFPIHNFVANTESSEEDVNEKFGYGLEQFVREGAYNWKFQFTLGALTLLKKLRIFNGQPVFMLFYDNNGVLFGTKTPDGLGVKGVKIQNYHAPKWKISDGSKSAVYELMVNFEAKQINENIAFISAKEFELSDIKGLTDLTLTKNTFATGVINVSVSTTDNNDNIYDAYKTQLATTGVWKAFHSTTGTTIPITSVVGNDNTKAFTITLNTAAPPYPTTGNSFLLSLAAPSVLDAADIVSFEGANTITQTI